jgi:hypothetical protein
MCPGRAAIVTVFDYTGVSPYLAILPEGNAALAALDETLDGIAHVAPRWVLGPARMARHCDLATLCGIRNQLLRPRALAATPPTRLATATLHYVGRSSVIGN